MDNFPHPPTMILIAAAVVALVFILNRFLFGPLNRILAQRQEEIETARAEFEEAQRLQNERLDEVESRMASSRKEAYSIREQAHAEAREHREKVLGEARDDAARQIDAARSEINEQISQARTQLESDADELAARIAERVLGRPVESDGGQQ